MTGLPALVFVGTAVPLAALLLLVCSRSPRARLRGRARVLSARLSATANASDRRPSVTVKRAEPRSVPAVEAFARRFLPRQSVLRERLARTGCGLTVGSYLLLCAGLALVLLAAVSAAFHLPSTPALLIALAGGVGLPHLAVGLLARRNCARFLAVLPDAIDLIVRGLKSGLPVVESIAAVGREMAPPLGGEFRRVTDNVRLGRSLEEALWDSARKMAVPEFNFFVISVSIQRETGGNLAETLTNLSDILRRRRQMRLRVKALSSEAKASAYILGSLPFAMFGLVYVSNPGYAEPLFTDPRGVVMLGSGLASIAVAAVVIARMIRFEI